MSLFEELKKRKLVALATPGVEKAFERKTTLYLGIDPTGDSLHIGHFLPLSILKRALHAGNKIIIIMGGGTALIGDPSGKEKERPILPKENLKKNKEKLKKQIEKFFKVDNKTVKIIDNANWLEKTILINFLRDIGKITSVNAMLDIEFVRRRIENNEFLSFAEFTYQILQAYDFYILFKNENCEIQVGGTDQWGNIVQGIELIKKKTGKRAYGLAFPLITDPTTGKKFGKTATGKPIWLDPKKTSPFELYQFLYNTSDDLSKDLLLFYSFKPIKEIEKITSEASKSPEKRITQQEIAYELTTIIHGKEISEICKKTQNILFKKKLEEITNKDLAFATQVVNVYPIKKSANEIDILLSSKLALSKKQARKLLKQQSVKITKTNEYILVKKGKKSFSILKVE